MRPHSLISDLFFILWIHLVLHAAHAQSNPRRTDQELKPRATVEEPDPPKNITYVKFSKMKPLPQMIPSGETGKLYTKFQPYLYIKSGCKPYPAIDEQARISKGLKANDPRKDKYACHDSKGQVYVRSQKYKKYYAIMYAWYFPRDATWVESLKDGAGHIHDLENAIVWLKADKSKVVAVSPSAHGGYKSYLRDDFNFKQGSHPLIAYGQPWDGVRNHQLLKADDDEIGAKQKIVAWESMNDKMRLAMDTDRVFNGCTSGVRDQDFESFLATAYAQVQEELL